MRWLLTALSFCAGLLVGATNYGHAAEETPTYLDGVVIITPDELRLMLDKGVKVYDLRKKASFVDGHVPGAKSAVGYYNAEKTTLDTSFLGPNRSQDIVFYSHGTTGWKSYWSARRAAESGYTNVMWMRGGFREWSAEAYPVSR